jgi:intracellular sulfur oxidation DsrE/DsrF family protein
MKKDDLISEEQLNALVDGELDSEEGGSVFDAAENSSELDRRLCQQRKLKELVKHAYQEIPEPRRRISGARSRDSVIKLTMAASVLLVFGLASGLLIHNYLDQGSRGEAFAASSNTQPIVNSENYILHIVSGEPQRMKTALQTAHELLSAAEPGSPRRVEIIANDRGLDLLRSDVTLFGEEIRALSRENVLFYACSKAIERLEERGVEVVLVPEAIPGFTALDRVVVRMKDGWQYIKL